MTIALVQRSLGGHRVGGGQCEFAQPRQSQPEKEENSQSPPACVDRAAAWRSHHHGKEPLPGLRAAVSTKHNFESRLKQQLVAIATGPATNPAPSVRPAPVDGGTRFLPSLS
jgi:hypothetical protein